MTVGLRAVGATKVVVVRIEFGEVEWVLRRPSTTIEMDVDPRACASRGEVFGKQAAENFVLASLAQKQGDARRLPVRAVESTS